MEAGKKLAQIWQHASSDLKSDQEFKLQALRSNPCLWDVQEWQRGQKEDAGKVMLEWIEKYGEVLSVSESLLTNKTFCAHAVSRNEDALHYVSKSLLKDVSFCSV